MKVGFKQLRVKIFTPGNKKCRQMVLRAPSGRLITPQGIDNQLENLVNQVETLYPAHDYRLVALGPNVSNFVWQREKESVGSSR